MECECCDKEQIRKMGPMKILRHIFSTNSHWMAERKLVLFTIASAFFLLGVLFLLYIGMWKSIPKFDSKIPLLALAAISSAVIVGAAYHFNAYKKPTSCMIGMMEGMTFGMMAGFIIGALVGATNGMFWGSAVGLVSGSIIGMWAGRCCGIMGIMEGFMAGIMSGTMGAMLSVMLLAEPLPLFLVLLIGSCSLVLLMLSYMRLYEHGKVESVLQIDSLTSVASTSLIFFIVLALIMVYGPKSGPIWLG